MFTGIIAGRGLIKNIKHFQTHTRVQVQSSFSIKGTQLGDSIALDGCCLTVTELKGRVFSADISPETLSVTSLGELKKSQLVNLELPLQMGDRLGGHLVQGHVDGVGKILSSELVSAKPESYYLIRVRLPKKLAAYMVTKGSVTVDGISLTVNKVRGAVISLCIIPHTQDKTTLTEKKVGATLNIEADILLKFVEKMLEPAVARAVKRLAMKGMK